MAEQIGPIVELKSNSEKAAFFRHLAAFFESTPHPPNDARIAVILDGSNMNIVSTSMDFLHYMMSKFSGTLTSENDTEQKGKGDWDA